MAALYAFVELLPFIRLWQLIYFCIKYPFKILLNDQHMNL